MGFQGSSVCLVLCIAVINTNAWSVVPVEKSVVEKDGTTHTVSKYSFIPDPDNETSVINKEDIDQLLKDINAHNEEEHANDAYKIYVKRKFTNVRSPVNLRTDTVETVSSPVDQHVLVSEDANNEHVSIADGPASSRVITSPTDSKIYVLKSGSNGANVRPQFNISSSAREIRAGSNLVLGSDQTMSSASSGGIVAHVQGQVESAKLEQDSEKSTVVDLPIAEHKDDDNSYVYQGLFPPRSQANPSLSVDINSLKEDEVINLIRSYVTKLRQNREDTAKLRSQLNNKSSVNVISIPLVRSTHITNNGRNEENLVAKEPKVENINGLLRQWQDVDDYDHTDVDLVPYEIENEQSPDVDPPPIEPDEVRVGEDEQANKKNLVEEPSIVGHKDLDHSRYPLSSSSITSVPLVRVKTPTDVGHYEENPSVKEPKVDNINDVLRQDPDDYDHTDIDPSPYDDPPPEEPGDLDDADEVLFPLQEPEVRRGKVESPLSSVVSVPLVRVKTPTDVGHNEENPTVKESKVDNLNDVLRQDPDDYDHTDIDPEPYEIDQENEQSPDVDPPPIEPDDLDDADEVLFPSEVRAWKVEQKNEKSTSSVVKKDLSKSPSQSAPNQNEVHSLEEGEVNNTKNDDIKSRLISINSGNAPKLPSKFIGFGPHNQVSNGHQISSILIHNINPVSIDGNEIHAPVQIDCISHPGNLLHNPDLLNSCNSLDDRSTITFFYNLVYQLQQRPNQNNEILIELIKKIIEQQSQTQHSAAHNIQLVKFVLYLYNLQKQNPNQNIQNIINSNKHLINLWIHQHPNSNIQITDSKIAQIVIDLFKQLNYLNQQQPNKNTALLVNILQNFANQYEHNHHSVRTDPSQDSNILVLLQNFIDQQKKAPTQNPAVAEVIQKIKLDLEQLINRPAQPEVQKPNQDIQSIIDIIGNLNNNKPQIPNENPSNKVKAPTVHDLNVIIRMFTIEDIRDVLHKILQVHYSNPNNLTAKWVEVFYSIFEIFKERQNQNIHLQNVAVQLSWFLARPDRLAVLDLLRQNWFQNIIIHLKYNNLTVLKYWNPYLETWLIYIKKVKPNNSSIHNNPDDVEPDHGKNPTVQDLNVIINVFTLDHIRAVLYNIEQTHHLQNNDITKWRQIFRLIFEVLKARKDLNVDKHNLAVQIAWFSADPIRRYVLDLLQQQWLQHVMTQIKNNNLQELNNPQWVPYLQVWLIQLEKVKQEVINDHDDNDTLDDNPNRPHEELSIQLEDLLAIVDMLIAHIATNAPYGFCPQRFSDTATVYLQQKGYATSVINPIINKYKTLVDTLIQNKQNIYSQCY